MEPSAADSQRSLPSTETSWVYPGGFSRSVIVFWPGLSLFFVLFETETAWQLLKTDLAGLLEEVGFQLCERTFMQVAVCR